MCATCTGDGLRTEQEEKERLERVRQNWIKIQQHRLDFTFEMYKKSPTFIKARSPQVQEGGRVIIRALHRLAMEHGLEERSSRAPLDPRAAELLNDGFVRRRDLLTEFNNWTHRSDRTRTTELDRLTSTLTEDGIIEKHVLAGERTKRSKEGKKKASSFYRIKGWTGEEGISDEEWYQNNKEIVTVGDLLMRARLAFMKEAFLRLTGEEVIFAGPLSDEWWGKDEDDPFSRPSDRSMVLERGYRIVEVLSERDDADTVLRDMWVHVCVRMEEIFGKEMLEIEVLGSSGLRPDEERILLRPWGGAVIGASPCPER